MRVFLRQKLKAFASSKQPRLSRIIFYAVPFGVLERATRRRRTPLCLHERVRWRALDGVQDPPGGSSSSFNPFRALPPMTAGLPAIFLHRRPLPSEVPRGGGPRIRPSRSFGSGPLGTAQMWSAIVSLFCPICKSSGRARTLGKRNRNDKGPFNDNSRIISFFFRREKTLVY